MECTSPWTEIVQGGSRVDNFALSFLSEQRQIDVIKKTNDYTNQFGLSGGCGKGQTNHRKI